MANVRKLIAGLLVVSALVIGAGVLGMTRLATAQEHLHVLYRDSLQAIGWLGEVRSDAEASNRWLLELALANDPASRTAARTQIVELDASADANWVKYTATDMRGRDKLRDDVDKATRAYREIRDGQLIPLIEAGRTIDYRALSAERVAPLMGRIRAALAGLDMIEDNVAAQALADSDAAYTSSRMLIGAIIAASLVLSIGLAGWIAVETARGP